MGREVVGGDGGCFDSPIKGKGLLEPWIGGMDCGGLLVGGANKPIALTEWRRLTTDMYVAR